MSGFPDPRVQEGWDGRLVEGWFYYHNFWATDYANIPHQADEEGTGGLFERLQLRIERWELGADGVAVPAEHV